MMSNQGERSAYVVTGTTRGIGRALAEQIVARGDRLYSLSRAPDSRVGAWHNYECDLRYPDQVDQAMTRILDEMGRVPCRDAVLICNAGVLGPIEPVGDLTPDQIAEHMQVNLLTPIFLIGLFLRATRQWQCRRRIIAMSSGAGRHPYAGWSLYCGSKAGLDMVVRCAAREQQAGEANPVTISAVAPGVVATDMQTEIRGADEAHFPARARFVELHASGKLSSPKQVAATILELDAGGRFVNGGLYDLRDVDWQNGCATIAPRLIDP
jgi:benzil reductase ((S)-benzoin forming)